MEFKEYSLLDCLHDIIDYRGKTPKKLGLDWVDKGPYRAISAKNIKKNELVNIGHMKNASENLYFKWMTKEIEKGDILLTSEAPLGESLYWDSDEKLILSQRIFCLKPNNKIIYSKFLFAQMQTRFFLHQLDSRQSGTTVTGIRRKELEKVTILVPDYNSQKTIGNFYYNLNEKIKINSNIIANLEKLSQTLFKRWFVDFEFPDANGNPYKSSGGEIINTASRNIPKNWNVIELKELLTNTKNNIKPGEYTNTHPYVPIDLIPMKKLNFYEYKDGSEAKSSLLKFDKNDILLGSMRVYFHRVSLAPYSGTTRSTVFVLKPKHEYLTYYLLHFINQKDFISFASNSSSGSTIPYAVWNDTLENYLTILPSKKVLDNFNNKVRNLFDISQNLLLENKNLIELRDTLLPKLMSGEIELPDELEVDEHAELL